jgi:multiple sugar transport system permease protein
VIVHRLPVTRRLLLTGAGLCATGLMVFPFYWLIVTSLRSPADLQNTPTPFPVPPYTSAYREVVSHGGLATNLVNSLIYGISATGLTIVLGVTAAYALARLDIRGKNITLFSLLLLQTMPGIMLAIPLFVMFSRLHMINTRASVILAITTKTLPFAILMLRPYFASLPQDIESAAAVDGCSRLATLRRIVLPLSLPGIVTVAAFNFLSGWGDLLFSLTLLTDDSKKPISLGLYRFMGTYGVEWNQLMAASIIAAVPAVLVFFLAQRYLVSGLTAGATND